MRRLSVCVFVSLILAGCSDRPSPASRPEEKQVREVKILQFYATPTEAEVGTQVLLCYGVENARSVRIEPSVEQLKPAYSHCIAVTPNRETAYTLTAEGVDGKTASSSITVKVKAKTSVRQEAEMIQLFTASSTEVQPGSPVTLCYSVDGADSVRIEPEVPELKNPRQGCVLIHPDAATTYTLVAKTSRGKTERKQLSVAIK